MKSESCCEKFRRKGWACKGCPVIALPSQKKRKRKLKRIRRELEQAA